MNTIQEMFQQSQLAKAAYANFFSTAGLLLTEKTYVIEALKNSGMSDTQATDFATQWHESVSSQIPAADSLPLYLKNWMRLAKEREQKGQLRIVLIRNHATLPMHQANQK